MNNTYFTFGGLTFQQISGTAMGAPFSPTIANIYMSVILSKYLKLKRTAPLLVKRYIDDIFLIWTDSIDNLHTFLKELNSFHSCLRFTHQLSSGSIDFLDLTIYKGNKFRHQHPGYKNVPQEVKPVPVSTLHLKSPRKHFSGSH